MVARTSASGQLHCEVHRLCAIIGVATCCLHVRMRFSAQGVAKGTLTVGDTILFLSLLSQLYAPLNYFGERHYLAALSRTLAGPNPQLISVHVSRRLLLS